MSIPFLILQGVTDALVPPEQSCSLAQAAGDIESYHIDVSGAVVTQPPAGCEDSGVSWLPGPRPSTSWPNEHYLLVYDDVGHGFEGAGAPYLINDFLAFVLANVPAD